MNVSQPVAHDFPLRGRTIVLLSTIDWDFLWQGHQEIASRLAAAGNRVIFVENTGVRTVRLADAARLAGKAVRWLRQSAGERRTPVPGVTVVAPLLLPFPRSRVATLVNERLLLPRLARRIRAPDGKDPVIFTYLPTPTALRLIELLRGPRSVIVYYCVADFRELSDQGEAITSSERALVSQADLVFVQGAALARRFEDFRSRMHEFPAGVNLEVFDPTVHREMHEQVRGLPRPIVGYTGGLHRHVDFALLARLARSIPRGSLVLVGPLQADPGPLGRERNVHFIGSRELAELPGYVRAFDVGLVPYVRSTYTDTVYPTKLFEYLAMGRPVVATDLPEVRKLRLPPSALRVAADAESFITAVHDLIAHPNDEAVGERIRLARERDWGAVVRRMAALIASCDAKRERAGTLD